MALPSREAGAAVQGAISLAVLQTAGRGLGLFLVVALTHSFRPEEFARYSIVAALVMAGSLIADFGTMTVVTRRVSRGALDTDVLLSKTLPFSALLGLVVYVGVLLFVLVDHYPRHVFVDASVGCLAVPINSVLTSIYGALDGRGLTSRRAFLSFVQTAFLVAGGAVPVLFGLGIRYSIAAMAAAPLGALLLARSSTRRAGVWRGQVSLDMRFASDLLQESLPYALLMGISALALRFDLILLSLLRTPLETGQYDFALRIIEALSYIGAVVATPALFILGRRLSNGQIAAAQRAFDQAARVTYLLGLPISAALVPLAGPAVTFLTGPGYSEATLPLAVLGGQLWLSFINGLQGALIAAGHAPYAAVRAAGSITAIGIALDVLVIGPFGSVGAATTTVVAQIAGVFIFARFNRRTNRIVLPAPPIGAIVAALVCGTTAATVASRSPAVAAILGAASYLVVLLLTRTFSFNDVRRLQTLLAGRADSKPL